MRTETLEPQEAIRQTVSEFSYETKLDAPAKTVFRWHARHGALKRLIPPWMDVDILAHEGIEPGARTMLQLHFALTTFRWIAEHADVSEGRSFKDVQIKGPFRLWEHTHVMEPAGEAGCRLRDDVSYQLPLALLDSSGADRYVRRQLKRQFAYRHRITENDLRLHQKYRRDPLRVAVSGSSGLIGSQLVAFLKSGGHDVLRIVREESDVGDSDIYWNHREGVIDVEKLEGCDAVIHLAGENVLSPRWSQQKKMEIFSSRVGGTEHLSKTLAGMENPPKTFLSASAIGFYGDRGAEELDETSPPGDDGFLSALCQDWERTTAWAAEAGIRTVQMRVGVVLTPRGGVLQPLVIPFRMGLGGRYGGRNQYMSWIGRDDVVGAVYHLLTDETIEGPVNLTAPSPVTMSEFADVLGEVLSKPVYLDLPPWLIRLFLGQVADDAALMSSRVQPKQLLDAGYEFMCPDLENVLRHTLGRAE